MPAENAPQFPQNRDSYSHKEDGVTQKIFLRGVLVIALCVVLAAPAAAQTGNSGYGYQGPILGPILAVAAALVVVIVVVVHESRKKRMITGCVNSGENGMSVTDEKVKRVYALSGNTTDIKPGDRVTLRSKKVNPNGANKPLTWKVSMETKDFGACQP
jgi:hypothetical protein